MHMFCNVLQTIAAALQSPEPEDSEVQFVVMTVDKQGKEAELGVARCSLEGLLSLGSDLAPTGLPLVDAKGVELGKLTCSVTALATLREIEVEAAGGALESTKADGTSHTTHLL